MTATIDSSKDSWESNIAQQIEKINIKTKDGIQTSWINLKQFEKWETSPLKIMSEVFNNALSLIFWSDKVNPETYYELNQKKIDIMNILNNWIADNYNKDLETKKAA